MAFIPENSVFPPYEYQELYLKFKEWSAWYSSDLTALTNYYISIFDNPDSPSNDFQREQLQNEVEQYLHVPLAGDIAQTSSNLLFGERPIISIPSAMEESNTQAVQTQERLDDILDQSDFYSRLLEAAETSSAFGGVFLKVNYDTDFLDFPVIEVVQPDNAFPVFKFGMLQEVFFHEEILRDGDRVVRLIERHTKEQIEYSLYDGSLTNIGNLIPLSTFNETSELDEVVTNQIDKIQVVYIPNLRPNRIFRNLAFGNSDYQGIEGLFDSIDVAYTNWINEIIIGKLRIVVPEQWLQNKKG